MKLHIGRASWQAADLCFGYGDIRRPSRHRCALGRLRLPNRCDFAGADEHLLLRRLRSFAGFISIASL